MDYRDIYRYWGKRKRWFWLLRLVFHKIPLTFTRYDRLAGHLLSYHTAGFIDFDAGKKELKKPGMIGALANPDNAMLRLLWGREWAPFVADAVSRRREGILQRGWMRRCFRSGDDVLCAETISHTLSSFLLAKQYDFTPKSLLEFYFAMPEYFEPMSAFNSEIVPMLIAAGLDREDAFVTEACRKAIYEDTGKVTHTLIWGLFLSRRESSWKMAADLLIAARLQEGLRQAVVELCSDGNLPAFRYMLAVMREHKMIRFASVVRAFDVWTGLGFEAARPATVKNAFDEACELLFDESAQEGAITGDNPMRVYLGLWALGSRECAEAKERVLKLVRSRETSLPVKAAALGYLGTSDFRFPVAEAVEIMKESGDELLLWGCMMPLLKTEETGGDRALWEELKRVMALLPAKKTKRKHPVFDWQEVELSQEPAAERLVLLAHRLWDGEVLKELFELAPKLPTSARQLAVSEILHYLPRFPLPFRWLEGKKRRTFPVREEARAVLLGSLADRSSTIRQSALELLGQLRLTEAEQIKIESILGGRNSSLRREALSLLRRRRYRKASAERLRASGEELKISAADELERRRKGKVPECSARNGYGLYRPRVSWRPVLPRCGAEFHPKALLRRHLAKVEPVLTELDRLVGNRNDEEYLHTFAAGYRETVTIGASRVEKEVTIDTAYNRADEALPEVWDEFFACHKLDSEELLAMGITAVRNQFAGDPWAFRLLYGAKSKVHLNYAAFLQEIVIRELRKRPDFPALTEKILHAVATHTPRFFWWMTVRRDPGGWYTPARWEKRFAFWYAFFRELPCSEANFSCRVKLGSRAVTLKDYLRALDTGAVPENEVFRYIFSQDRWHIFGEEEWKLENRHRLLVCCVNSIADREIARGEQETATTRFAARIPLLQGTGYFVRILVALGEYPLVRGYSWSGAHDKPNALCSLLKVCRPLAGENAETLRALLAETPVAEKRLIEAAMYAPAWLPAVGECLGVPDLPVAGWYFHAHISEFFSAEKETFVARYSAVTPQEFNEGAFDGEWLKAAVAAVGQPMFDRLYDAAKYISTGTYHRRSQIFADAALGRLTAPEIGENIKTKRNKEFVMAYGVAPAAKEEILHRYQVLTQFRKESRQFGSQRQTSEKQAFETAVANLARTAGFDDVVRFLWQMESEEFREIETLLQPHKESDYTLRLEIREDGSPEAVAEKGGKVLKAIPAALRKSAFVEELRSAAKRLREQRSRARQSLENAMVRGDLFDAGELAALEKNPVLSPLVNALLFRRDKEIGFRKEFKTGKLAIAHPVDLLDSGRWAEFQRYAVENKLKQPFKQIFRELYTLNEDEKQSGAISRRYAGNQIMPKKGMAMLRTRGWTVDMETGLQKVHHRADVTARIFAQADWFAPSEIEPPTLEQLQFEHRRTGKLIPFSEIPPVLFSEVMRDLDLLVSVAHAGGVDPEASHSTVEMRAALIGSMLPLFKLKNVRIEKSHAFVKGEYGDYTVHLGSGVCHKQAAGMIHILAVQSQTRGRVFLPFLDDDPKTAEIVTKVLFLAEDKKIKDPNILNRIRG